VTPGAGGGIPWQAIAALGAAIALAFAAVGLVHAAMQRRVRALQRAHDATFEIMSRVIDSVGRYADNHSRRVAETAVTIARALGVPGGEIEDIRIGALLHGISRLDIPAEAIAKAGGFTKDELEEAGTYAGRGVRSVAEGRPAHETGDTLRRVLPIVTCLEERWDGTGRKALQGREIPLGACILAVADAYDTMVTDRPYQKARTHEEAVAAIRRASGSQFDPLVVEVFVRQGRASSAETPEAKAA
jgi:HD-GYP domain-containing protein (c-di-GMP phosphodiesterase class II)